VAYVNKSALVQGSTTVQPTYSSATAGNLLVAFVCANVSSAASFTLSGATAGWTRRQSAVAGPGAAGLVAEIWDKQATGSDAMPTWNGGTTLMSCEVAEFSGTVIYDKGGAATGTVSPVTYSCSSTDVGLAELIVFINSEREASTAHTAAFTNNVNSLGSGSPGTGVTVLGTYLNSAVNHVQSAYVTTATTGTSADNNVQSYTVSTGTTNYNAYCIASYRQPFTTVGTFAQAGSTSAYPGSLSVSPKVLGDILVVGTSAKGATSYSLSGGGVTTWTRLTSYTDGNGILVPLYWGIVTSTGANTLTITAGGSPSKGEIWAQEFAAPYGASPQLQCGFGTASGSGTTTTFPSLAAIGAYTLYVGYQTYGQTVSAGSTANCTYQVTTTIGDLVVWNGGYTGTSPTASQTPTDPYGDIAAMLAYWAPRTLVSGQAVQRASVW